MPAKNTPKMITIAEAAANLREMFTDRVVDTWLDEFGYTSYQRNPSEPLQWAVTERGARIRRELAVHAKRLADRQTMGAPRITGKASVVPR
jgi:hypothetical protein